MTKKILCKSCTTEIGLLADNKLLFKQMKAISMVEIDGDKKDVKCHTCHNWNSFDKDNTQSVNYQKKAAEALYNFGKK
jgi:hypothetical protein